MRWSVPPVWPGEFLMSVYQLLAEAHLFGLFVLACYVVLTAVLVAVVVALLLSRRWPAVEGVNRG